MQKRHRITVTLTSLLLGFLYSSSAIANAMSQGERVAKQADAQLRGYVDSLVELTMELTAPSGQTATRSVRVQSLEADDGEYTLMVFDTPRDVAGTSMLTHNYRDRDHHQWIYLPVIRRVKQIGARDKSGPFMGSEFAYEDIVSPFYEKFSYQLETAEEECAGTTCWVIERIPKDPNSGYTRQRVWVGQDHYLIHRIEYFDRRNVLLKTYTAEHFIHHNDSHWRASQMLMENHQNKRKTRLIWSNFRFENGLNRQDFNQNALMRTR